MTSLLIQFQLRRIINLHTILLTGSALFQMRMNKGTYLLQMGNVIVNMCNVKLLAPEKLYEPNTLNQGNGSLKTKKQCFLGALVLCTWGPRSRPRAVFVSFFLIALGLSSKKNSRIPLDNFRENFSLNQSTAQTKVPSTVYP